MNALTRVFAGELVKTTLQQSDGSLLSPVLVTPGGAYCSGIFFVGALTRIDLFPGDFMEVWVADPTGMFLVVPGRQDTGIRDALRAMEPPVFIAVSGEVQPLKHNKKPVQVRPVDIRAADRTIRDSWVIRTAEITLERLYRMKSALEGGTEEGSLSRVISHYHTDLSQILELEDMVREALMKAGPVQGGAVQTPDHREVILDLIRMGSGPRGIAMTDLVPLAARSGINNDQVIAVVRQLVLEDECYQPAAGYVKLL